MELIDLHCHMLPGIDDGSRDMDMSLEMARSAVNQGISHLLLTPHHMNNQYVNHRQEVIDKTTKFQMELNKYQIPLKVYPGQEVHLTGSLLEAIANNDILFMDESNRYLLLELPHNSIPEYSENMIFQLLTQGITPVIAHPERNMGFQQKPDRLYDFVEQGCLTQLTSGSYLGIFGRRVEEFTESIIKANLGFAFSSDAHDLTGRRFLMSDAFNKLSKHEGNGKAKQFNENAKKILNGEDVSSENILKISSMGNKKKIWDIFK